MVTYSHPRADYNYNKIIIIDYWYYDYYRLWL